jgi:hypothetical protein
MAQELVPQMGLAVNGIFASRVIGHGNLSVGGRETVG